jgi:hypothetical protein
MMTRRMKKRSGRLFSSLLENGSTRLRKESVMADCPKCGKHILDEKDARMFVGASPDELNMCCCDMDMSTLLRYRKRSGLLHPLEQGLYETWLRAVQASLPVPGSGHPEEKGHSERTNL